MSARDDRRLRLEMLSMRAELQRMELQQQVQDVRNSLGWGRLLVTGVQRLMQNSSLAQGSALARQFMQQYPMLTMVGSMGFGLFRKPILRVGVKMAVLGAVGGGLWWWWNRSRLPQVAPRDLNSAGLRDAEGPDGQTTPRLGH